MAIKELECPNCGANLGHVHGSVIYCEYCGSKLKQEREATPIMEEAIHVDDTDESGDIESMDNFKEMFGQGFNMQNQSTKSTFSATITRNGKTVKLSGDEARAMSEDINENVQKMMSQFFKDKK